MKNSLLVVITAFFLGGVSGFFLAIWSDDAVLAFLKKFSEELRQVLPLIAFFVAVFGILLAVWRNFLLSNQEKNERKDVRAKTFKGCVELLDSKEAYARQGALRALELYVDTEAFKNVNEQLAVYRIISGFIQARRPSSRISNENISDDSDVDVVTAVTILREKFNEELYHKWKNSWKKHKENQRSNERKNDGDSEKRIEIDYVELSNVQFPDDTDLSKSFFPHSNFSDSTLKDALLEEIDLTESNLAGTDLTSADLRKAKLKGVTCNEATKLDGADLRGADLTGAQGLSEKQMKNCTTDKDTKLPSYLEKTGS